MTTLHIALKTTSLNKTSDFCRPVMECECTSFCQKYDSFCRFRTGGFQGNNDVLRLNVPLSALCVCETAQKALETCGVADKRRPSAWLCDGKNAVRVTGPREDEPTDTKVYYAK